jgi:hypothetical protein
MAIIGPFPASMLLSDSHHANHQIDFRSVTCEDLHDIKIPLVWRVQCTGIVHGVAGWFDCGFDLGVYMDETEMEDLAEVYIFSLGGIMK